MQREFNRIATAIILRLVLPIAVFAFSGCANAQAPMTSAQRERMETHAQDVILPLVRGVTYDPASRHAYYSACERREYACDLYRIDLIASAPRATVIFRSAQYGYVWPSLSPNGRTLAAVRVRRSERLNARNEDQDLVEIDLATGDARVLANAQGGRFTRVEHLANDLIAVVRTYRSSPAFTCRGDLCTDRGEVLLWDRGTMTTLPMRTNGAASSFMFLPLSAEGVTIIRTVWSSGIPSPMSAFLIDIRTRGRNAAFATWRDALDFVVQEHGSIRAWNQTIIRNGSYRIEELPFHRQLPLSLVVLQQTHLANSSSAVGLEKRLDGSFVFQVCENLGQLPWTCRATEFQRP